LRSAACADPGRNDDDIAFPELDRDAGIPAEADARRPGDTAETS
jgi:hypothetical protein